MGRRTKAEEIRFCIFFEEQRKKPVYRVWSFICIKNKKNVGLIYTADAYQVLFAPACIDSFWRSQSVCAACFRDTTTAFPGSMASALE